MMRFPYDRDHLMNGTVHHHRLAEKSHQFSYRVLYTLINLDSLKASFSRSRLWSVNGPNLISFRDTDYLPGDNGHLKERVVQLVEEQTGKPVHPQARVWLLSQLRHFGKSFNPVCFYLISQPEAKDEWALQAIVAEITNTPWDERHSYVLPVDQSISEQANGSETVQFRFDKQFHVSPFLPMALAYDWRFHFSEDGLNCHMAVSKDKQLQFTASLNLKAKPLTRVVMRWLPFRYASSSLLTLARIYWQAFRLWLKKTTFYPHPRPRAKGRRIN